MVLTSEKQEWFFFILRDCGENAFMEVSAQKPALELFFTNLFPTDCLSFFQSSWLFSELTLVLALEDATSIWFG